MLGPRRLALPSPRRPGDLKRQAVKQPKQVPQPLSARPTPDPQGRPPRACDLRVRAPAGKVPRKKVMLVANLNSVSISPKQDIDITQLKRKVVFDTKREVTYDDIAARASELLTTLQTPTDLMPRGPAAFNGLREGMDGVPRQPVHERESMFAMSVVKTPEPGFSVRGKDSASAPLAIAETRIDGPLPRLDTASEMIWPDGRRGSVPE